MVSLYFSSIGGTNNKAAWALAGHQNASVSPITHPKPSTRAPTPKPPKPQRPTVNPPNPTSHLLPKKSWNPYAPAAIARVKADEAAFAAREQEHKKLLAEHESAKRLAQLRGVTPPPSPPPLEAINDEHGSVRSEKRSRDPSERDPRGKGRKRRRLAGEDDTDRDIRLAREGVEVREDKNEQARTQISRGRECHAKKKEMPITDRHGHIQLFAPEKKPRRGDEKNEEAEAERERREREMEDQYTLRFSNAAGFKKGIKDKPWYADGNEGGTGCSGTEVVTEAVAGEIIHKRYEGRQRRDAARRVAADPMSMMKSAQAKLKQVHREKEEVRREREHGLMMLRQEQEEGETSRKARHGGAAAIHDGLEGFSLDAPSHEHGKRPGRHIHKSHCRHKHRSSEDDNEHRHRHRYSSRQMRHNC